MKSFTVFFLSLAMGSVAHASQVRLTCKAAQGGDSIWAMSVDASALSSPGRYRVKVDGLYLQQVLETTPNGTFSFHHQNGSNEVIVPVSSAADAGAKWEATSKADSGSLPSVDSALVGREFDSFYYKKQKGVYLRLFRDSEQDGFSYNGFCRLAVHR